MPPASVDDRVRRDTAHLPDELRGSVVLLRFAEPISRIASHPLMRVRLPSGLAATSTERTDRAVVREPDLPDAQAADRVRPAGRCAEAAGG